MCSPCLHLRERFWRRAGTGGVVALAIQLATVLLIGGLAAGPALAQDSSLLNSYEKRLEGWFRRIDRNGDGRISPGESKGHPFLEMNFERLDAPAGAFCCPRIWPRPTTTTSVNGCARASTAPTGMAMAS